jgi:hypothetical protein
MGFLRDRFEAESFLSEQGWRLSMRQTYLLLLLAFVLARYSHSQTLVDLRTQSKSVDFSALPATRPVQVGTSLPSTCQVGQLFFKSDAVAGANLYGCGSANAWTVQSSGSSGGGSGAAMASQLGDLKASRISNTVLTIGASCAATTPCNVHLGSTVFTITAGATATVSGSNSGALLAYVANNGMLTVGHNLTVTCNGCTAQSGVTSFPADSVPLASWTVTNGAIDAGGGVDLRAPLGTKNLTAGLGIQVNDSGGTALISADTSLISVRAAVPVTSSSACQQSSWAVDSNYIYVCVATNSWRRSSLSSW